MQSVSIFEEVRLHMAKYSTFQFLLLIRCTHKSFHFSKATQFSHTMLPKKSRLKFPYRCGVLYLSCWIRANLFGLHSIRVQPRPPKS